MTGIAIFMILHGLAIIEDSTESLREADLAAGQLSFLPLELSSIVGIGFGILLSCCAIGVFLKWRSAYGLTCVVSAIMVVYMIGETGVLLMGPRSGAPFGVYLIVMGFAVIYALIFRSVRVEWLKGGQK